MNCNGKDLNLKEFLAKRKMEWFTRDRLRGHTEEEINDGWNDEGVVWAVQEYYGSMGEFSDEDIETIEEEFGFYANGIICLCESDD